MKQIKRIGLSAMALVLGLSVLTACGGPSDTPGTGDFGELDMGPADESILNTDEEIEISFACSITGADSEYMQQLIADFNREYKGKINVRASLRAEASHYTTLIAAASNGTLPDLAIIHTERLAQFRDYGVLLDMTDYAATQSIEAEDYDATAWQNGVFDGGLYAIPYDLIPVVLYYNKDLIPEGCTEQDILDGLTFDEFDDMVRKATADPDPNDTSDNIYGWAFNYAQTSLYFNNWLAQAGQFLVEEDDPTEPTFNTDEGLQIATALNDLVDAGTVTRSGTNHFTVFQQGRALFAIDGVWQMTSADYAAESIGLNYGMAGMPIMFGDTSKVLTRSHCFTMLENNDSTEEKRQATIFFIRYLIEHSMYWMASGKLSVRNDVAQLDEYQALPVASVEQELVTMPLVSTYGIMKNEINETMALLCEGDIATPQEAITRAYNDAREQAQTAAGQ